MIDPAVDHLQQGHIYRRIIFDVKIIDILYQHDRVDCFGIFQGSQDSSRTTVHQGSTGPLNFVNFGDAADRQADKWPLKRGGDSFGQGGFSGPPRADQTECRAAAQTARQLSDRKALQDLFPDRGLAVVLGGEQLARLSYVRDLRGELPPGE